MKDKITWSLIYARKSICQNSTPSYDSKQTNKQHHQQKPLKLGIEENYLNITKGIYEKPSANTIFNGENRKLFL